MSFNEKISALYHQAAAAEAYRAARAARDNGHGWHYRAHMKLATWHSANARRLVGVSE